MKKIFAIICALCTLIPACASACGGIAVKIETGNTYTGRAYVAMEQEQHLTGLLCETEKAEVFPAPRNIRPYVRGVVENGIVRAKGVLAYHEISGIICGLTETGCAVTIYPEYAQAVAEIVARRIGEDAKVNEATIIACTQWRTETTITQIFYTEKTAWAVCGSVFFDGAQYPAALCIGDFNGDGAPELGYIAGGMPQEPEKPKEPEIMVVEKTVYVEKVVEKTVVNNCTKIIQDNRQININSNVTNKQKQTVIINGGKGCKPCLPRCIE